MKSRSAAILVMGFALFAMVISACMPPAATAEELAAMEKTRKDSVRKANSRYCMKHLSFATEYYKNKSYEDALMNYHKLFDYECVDEEMAKNVYVYMGNCYRDLDQIDSALYYYNEGLNILPDNKYLWDSKLFAVNAQGDDEKTLVVKIAMFEQFPENLELGEEIAEYYLVEARYDEAVSLIDILMEKDPDNKNLTNMKREAVEGMGGNVLGFLAEEYNKNPDNIPNALEYARELRSANELQQAIAILESILAQNPDMTNVIKMLVEIYGEIGQTQNMISMLKKLIDANPDDVRYYYDMTDAYILDGQLKSAMYWANKAIALKNNAGQAYANRAAVYEAVARECAGSVPDFDDKLVFLMAYEDYKLAKSKGWGKVNNKIDFLKEARIPQSGDWFFNKDDYVKGGKATPRKDCYTWLERSVNAPKN